MAYDKKDYKKAFLFFERAANGGDINAMNKLGLMYYKGQGTKKDYQKAKYWFEKAEAKGSAYSKYYLGFMYYFGKGVKKNPEIAKRFLVSACDKEVFDACKLLAVIDPSKGTAIKIEYY